MLIVRTSDFEAKLHITAKVPYKIALPAICECPWMFSRQSDGKGGSYIIVGHAWKFLYACCERLRAPLTTSSKLST
jgi:hypothetical protein